MKPLILLLALLCAGCGGDVDVIRIHKTATEVTDQWNRKWTCEPCPQYTLNPGDTIHLPQGWATPTAICDLCGFRIDRAHKTGSYFVPLQKGDSITAMYLYDNDGKQIRFIPEAK